VRAFHIVQVWKRLFEDMSVQKQEGLQGAVRGGGGALLVEGEVGEKSAEFGGPPCLWGGVCGETG
jgi:hypothetical protein